MDRAGHGPGPFAAQTLGVLGQGPGFVLFEAVQQEPQARALPLLATPVRQPRFPGWIFRLFNIFCKKLFVSLQCRSLSWEKFAKSLLLPAVILTHQTMKVLGVSFLTMSQRPPRASNYIKPCAIHSLPFADLTQELWAAITSMPTTSTATGSRMPTLPRRGRCRRLSETSGGWCGSSAQPLSL